VLVGCIVLAISGASILIPLLQGDAVDAMGIIPGTLDRPALLRAIMALGLTYFIDVGLIFLREFLMAGLSSALSTGCAGSCLQSCRSCRCGSLTATSPAT